MVNDDLNLDPGKTVEFFQFLRQNNMLELPKSNLESKPNNFTERGGVVIVVI